MQYYVFLTLEMSPITDLCIIHFHDFEDQCKNEILKKYWCAPLSKFGSVYSLFLIFQDKIGVYELYISHKI